MNNKKKGKSAKKDVYIENILKSKMFYWIILVLLTIYLFQSDRILNIPVIFFWIRYLITTVIFVLFFAYRYNKLKEYYIRKFKDKVYLFGLVIFILFFAFVGQFFLNIPFNFVVKETAKENPIEVHYCQITNAISTHSDKIHFKFMDRIYSRYFDLKNFKREDLIHHYYLVIETRPAFSDIYYIESMYLREK